MSLRTVSTALLISLTAGCGAATITKTEIRTVRVPYRAPCPEPDVYQGIKNARPVPLRTQPKPPTPEERSAKAQAQLGRYEAEGGWADRAMSALDRCQLEAELVNPNE